MSELETQDALSMEDDIRATLEDIQSRGVEIEEIELEPVATEPVKADRARDESGKFAKSAETGELELAAEIEQEKPARKAPSSWRKEAQEKFTAIDPLLQEEIERREQDFHKGIETYRTKAQQAEAWEEAVSPFAATINSFGVTPQEAAKTLFVADHRLRYGTPQQKQQMLSQLARDYGIELPGAQQQQEIDPQLQPLHQTLESLRQEQQQFKGYIQNQQLQAEQQAMQSLNSQIAEFSQGKEHFEAVRADMAALLQAGRAQNLGEAYEMAIWANPNVRSTLIAQQQAEARKEATRIAQEAKKADAVNVRRQGSLPQSPGTTGSMEDTIRNKLRELGMAS